jgi:CheY-like chemotaxis protein
LLLKIQTAQIQPIIQAAIDSLQPAAEAKGVRVEFVSKTLSAEIAVDPDRVQQVVWNLLSNAIKFSPTSGIVRISSELKDNALCITVSDNGRGIEPEFLPYVFETFSQADSTSARTHGGLGIGLAIVRHIVESHGGHVTAGSLGAGQGATFTVMLPVRTAEDPVRAKTPTRNPGRQSSLKDLQVLVVDDEVDTREMLTTILLEKGATVTSAGSVQEALASLEASVPSILVSDIAMPGEDGCILLKKLRDMEQAQHWSPIPAIALTAYARDEDRKAALDAGFEMHISKPFDPAMLVGAIVELVTKRLGKAV